MAGQWHWRRAATKARTDGTRYFFLSMVGMSVLSAFSQITYSTTGVNLISSRCTNEICHAREYDQDTSAGCALPLPCASLRRAYTVQLTNITILRNELTEGVLILELGTHSD